MKRKKRENSLQSTGDSYRKPRKLGKSPIMAFEWTYAKEIIFLKNITKFRHHGCPYERAPSWEKGGWYSVFNLLSKLEGFSGLVVDDLVAKVARWSSSYDLPKEAPIQGIATEEEYFMYQSFKQNGYPPPSMDNAPKKRPAKRTRSVSAARSVSGGGGGGASGSGASSSASASAAGAN